MAKNIENNKDIQWENIEKKGGNWWEAVKDFLKLKKHTEEIKVKEVISRKTEKLKDAAIDSTLDNLNLDMQEWLELEDSDIKTKEELNQIFAKWKEKPKDNVNTPEEQELYQKLLQSNRFKNRSPEAIQEIAKSATKVENEIKQWNSVFINMARKIMSTEK